MTIPVNGQERTWIDNTGKNRVEAEFLGVERAVKLRKKNGVIITVPFSRLSAADIAYLERMESDAKRDSTAERQPTQLESAKTKPAANSKTNSPVVRNTPKKQAATSPPAKSSAVSKSPKAPVKPTNMTPRMDEAELAIVRLTLNDLEAQWPEEAETKCFPSGEKSRP